MASAGVYAQRFLFRESAGNLRVFVQSAREQAGCCGGLCLEQGHLDGVCLGVAPVVQLHGNHALDESGESVNRCLPPRRVGTQINALQW